MPSVPTIVASRPPQVGGGGAGDDRRRLGVGVVGGLWVGVGAETVARVHELAVVAGHDADRDRGARAVVERPQRTADASCPCARRTPARARPRRSRAVRQLVLELDPRGRIGAGVGHRERVGELGSDRDRVGPVGHVDREVGRGRERRCGRQRQHPGRDGNAAHHTRPSHVTAHRDRHPLHISISFRSVHRKHTRRAASERERAARRGCQAATSGSSVRRRHRAAVVASFDVWLLGTRRRCAAGDSDSVCPGSCRGLAWAGGPCPPAPTRPRAPRADCPGGGPARRLCPGGVWVWPGGRLRLSRWRHLAGGVLRDRRRIRVARARPGRLRASLPGPEASSPPAGALRPDPPAGAARAARRAVDPRRARRRLAPCRSAPARCRRAREIDDAAQVRGPGGDRPRRLPRSQISPSPSRRGQPARLVSASASAPPRCRRSRSPARCRGR